MNEFKKKSRFRLIEEMTAGEGRREAFTGECAGEVWSGVRQVRRGGSSMGAQRGEIGHPLELSKANRDFRRKLGRGAYGGHAQYATR